MILEINAEERNHLINAIEWCALPDKNMLWNIKKQLMKDRDGH